MRATRRWDIAREISAQRERIPNEREKKMALKQLNDHRERPELDFFGSIPAGMKRSMWKAASPLLLIQPDAQTAKFGGGKAGQRAAGALGSNQADCK